MNDVETKPPRHGWYRTRAVRLKIISYSIEKAYWEGEWRYSPGNSPCLIQTREWSFIGKKLTRGNR